MIYTEQTANLEEQVQQLGKAILNSSLAQAYRQALKVKENDPETLEKIKSFKRLKKKFESISQYGNYAPDFQEQYRKLLQAKRELDMVPAVAEFRQAETALQEQLDHVVKRMAEIVSPAIKVDAGNPFFLESNKACGGNCHEKKRTGGCNV